MDSAYDKPPEPHYQCEVCKEKGDHYKSLCPANTDPFSLTKKRRRLQAKKLTERKDILRDRQGYGTESRKERSSDWGRLSNESEDWQYGDSHRVILSPMSRRETSKQARLLETREGRLSPELSLDELLASSGKNLPNRKRGREDELVPAHPDTIVGEEKAKNFEFPQKRARVDSKLSPDGSEVLGAETELQLQAIAEFGGALQRDITTSDARPTSATASPRLVTFNTDSITIDDSDSDTASVIKMGLINSLKNTKQNFTPFVQGLTNRNPSMRQVVNKPSSRVSATDMMDRENHQAQTAHQR